MPIKFATPRYASEDLIISFREKFTQTDHTEIT